MTRGKFLQDLWRQSKAYCEQELCNQSGEEIHTGKAMERAVASRALVKATTARAKNAMRKRQLFPRFCFPGGRDGMTWRLTRSATGIDHRERVCDHRASARRSKSIWDIRCRGCGPEFSAKFPMGIDHRERVCDSRFLGRPWDSVWDFCSRGFGSSISSISSRSPSETDHRERFCDHRVSDRRCELIWPSCHRGCGLFFPAG